MDYSLFNGRNNLDNIAAELAMLYIEKTYHFEKSTPETFAKMYRAAFETINTELHKKNGVAD